MSCAARHGEAGFGGLLVPSFSESDHSCCALGIATSRPVITVHANHDFLVVSKVGCSM